MNKLIFLLACLGFTAGMYAVPAKPKRYEAEQSDGTVLTVIKTGDENGHSFFTQDGQPVSRNERGDFVYVPFTGEEESSLPEMLAHNPEVRTDLEKAHIKNLDVQRILLKRRQPISRRVLKAATTASCQKSVVILVQFKDKKFSITDPKQEYERRYNGESGSVRQYFRDNSSGAFVPEFVIAGPVTLSRNYAYYGENDKNSGSDRRPREMVEEACRLADAEVDFSSLSLDEFGYVGSVYILYAGEGEATSNDANTVWPHAWQLARTLKLDDVYISSYACSNELEDGGLDGIGTFCHEFSHVLGLPDLYDADYEGSGGNSYHLNSWSVMATGCYNGNSDLPCFYTAVEREMLGWGQPVVLDEAGDYQLEPIGTTNRFYRINTPVDTEYFLLENRQQESWDEGLPYHGMLIYHVDKSDPYVWENNAVNCNPAHQYVDIEEADDRRVVYTGANYAAYLESMKGDPFPGLSGNTAFTDDTAPGSQTWKGKNTEKPVTGIMERDGIIRFSFLGGASPLATPVAREPEEVASGSFVARWDPVEGATGYDLYVFSVTNTGTGGVLTEPFDQYPPEAEGWEYNISSQYVSAPYFGENAPALKFSAQGSFLKTPEVTGEIHRFGFCLVAAGDVSGSTLRIEGWNGTTWLMVAELDVAMNDKTKKIITYGEESGPTIPGGLSALRFTYNKISGNLAFDDLRIEWHTGKRIYVKGYDPKQVGQVASEEVTGLDPDTRYCYEVVATGEGRQSAVSNRVEVVTCSDNGLRSADNGKMRIWIADNMLNICSPKDGEKADIYNLSGRLIQSVSLAEGDNRISLPDSPVYLVKCSGIVWKIMRSE